MNTMLRCLANTDSRSSNGYTGISFSDWSNLGSTLDTDILQQLADASPNAIAYSVYDLTDSSLSSDEVNQLVSFSTMLL